MPLTYTVSNAWTLASAQAKGMPVAAANKLLICDMVNSKIWKYRPWQRSLTTIAAGSIPMVEGTQDYSPPAQIYRLMKASFVRTDTTPDQIAELDVAQDLSVDLSPRSYTTIRCASLQAGAGVIRLESAVQVPTGVTIELQGSVQNNPTKIVQMNQSLWFDDHTLMEAFVEGINYWSYKLADDPRAGGLVAASGGRAQYSGQAAAFIAAMDLAASAEDFPAQDTYFPSESIGAGRDSGGGFSIFSW